MDAHSKVWDYECDGSVISVAATPNCSVVAAATVGKSVYLFDGDGRLIWKKSNLRYEAWCVAISDDGQFIAVGTANKLPVDGYVFVYTRNGNLIWTQQLRAPVWGISLSRDGQVLAASTWLNDVYLFQQQAGVYKQTKKMPVPGTAGLYGVRLHSSGGVGVVASAESGLYWFENSGVIAIDVPVPNGLYNVAIPRNTTTALCGTRTGSIVKASMTHREIVQVGVLSDRPICGVSATDDGSIIAAGSFDGRLIIADDRGWCLWETHVQGEVWSTAISAIGDRVCVACGDHHITMYVNQCNVAAYNEVRAVEDLVLQDSRVPSGDEFETLFGMYLRLGLTSYGYQRLATFLETNPQASARRPDLVSFLEQAAISNPKDAHIHFRLAESYAVSSKLDLAIRHYQLASNHLELRAISQRRAAECFSNLHLNTAASSAWRQSREMYVDDIARTVLFTLARSYEDTGAIAEARKIYQMILSYDVTYRNTYDRLDQIHHGRAPAETLPNRQDYTGITTNYLGADVPRHVDKPLDNVMKARSREIEIKGGDHEKVKTTVVNLLNDKEYSRGVRRDTSGLDYTTRMFFKYDYGLPEDEMKKFLETVNAMPFFEKAASLGGDALNSLDIGSATGRYPSLLRKMTFCSYGIDIARDAVEYATKQKKEQVWPKYIHGDGLKVDELLPGIEFDVITCMMGTFEHISASEQPTMVNALSKRLRPGTGTLIVSLWDIECPHLSYLSMYDERQKNMIRANGRTQETMCAMLQQAGLVDVRIVPFCLLPQTMVYDMGIDQMDAPDIAVAAQVDLTFRALFRRRHGEMFLAVGSSPSVSGA